MRECDFARVPTIIQGGMGMGVSNWELARAVSVRGQLGVVSGTAIDTILMRRLQNGDHGGHMRRALHAFPDQDIAQRILRDYFIEGGKREGQSYRLLEMPSIRLSPAQQQLIVAANFVEVYLAKEGHSGLVGINLLEKIAIPNLPSLYGAMLAGVDYVLMGAGIPREIPVALDRLSTHGPAQIHVHVEGCTSEQSPLFTFDPQTVIEEALPLPKRPAFLPIVASATLAIALAKKAQSRIDGFIVEGPLAGGHNAPPRGSLHLNERGEPLYGPRDDADLSKIRELGLPFWLAGSFADPSRLAWARAQGAAGIQVGTAFAFCRESGIRDDIKRQVLNTPVEAPLDLYTDPRASPTGFPFKVVQLAGTIADPALFDARPRICDLGYLRSAFSKPDGSVGYRCPAEPVEHFVMKGGTSENTEGRKCLCNGLQATVGLGQVRGHRYEEPALLTSGEDIKRIKRFLTPGQTSYSASDVIDSILGAIQ